MPSIAVPYFSQRDNQFNPGGSCNVTAIGMALWHLGIRGDGSYPQFEDQLYQKCEALGLDRHSPYDLKSLAETYPGVRDDFTEQGDLAAVRKAIDAGQVCVVHSFSTSAGHIWVIRGYDEKAKTYLVNDPNGEWRCGDGWGWYYENGSGDSLSYSARMVGATCGSWTFEQAQEMYNDSAFDPEKAGGFYLHRLTRGSNG